MTRLPAFQVRLGYLGRKWTLGKESPVVFPSRVYVCFPAGGDGLAGTGWWDGAGAERAQPCNVSHMARSRRGARFAAIATSASWSCAR